MEKLIARDRPIIVLEYNAARYDAPREFLDGLLGVYGSAQELSLTGDLLPLDVESVTNRANTHDRLLLFG
jgi:hypothetical protein